MTRQLEAVYEQGVLRPLEPLSLPEHQHVVLILEVGAEKAGPASSTAEERRGELRWLAENSGPYAGEWVALDDCRLIAHGAKLADVRAAATAAGVPEPFFASVPADSQTPFGGW